MSLSAIESLARLDALLEDALQRDLAGRRAWLDDLPPDLERHREMFAEVLLAPEGEDGNDTPCVLGALPQWDTAAEGGERHHAGEEVGPYRLIAPIGSGGMGTVWLAERADGAYQRREALKLPRIELSPGLLRRWRRERDILAGLEHPRIARLYDAGMDPRQQYYLALEYVDGEAIDTYADRHQLSHQVRLQLFLQVVEAVAYAHARGIIHRDLKPSNILVDRNGEVRLLDFGIAKLLEGEDTSTAGSATELAGPALTPDFASPEQLTGEAVGVASDIYSLAIVLYGLLTGRRPFEFRGRRTQAIAEAIRDTEAPLASLRTTSPTLRRQLRGDLDAILAKALRKRPADRYASMAEFGDDLRRHLAGEPVRAQRMTLGYRLRKLLWRQRLNLLRSLALVLASLALGYSIQQLAQRPADDAGSTPRMSIVVLPFRNQTGDASQDYVAEALTTSMTADLARIRDAYVVDLTTAATLKDKALSAREIGRELGVRFVLGGSVQRSGERIRVNAQLADTQSNTQLWSDTFEGNQANLFALQDQVTGRVGNSIGREIVILSARESEKRASNPRAADLILRAKAMEMQPRAYRLLPAREALWRQVLALDPVNVSAMANLAVVLTLETGDEGPGGALPDKLEEGHRLALKARELDPDQPDIYYALAIYHAWRDDFQAAREAAEKRLALDRNDPSAYNMLGNLLLSNGEPEHAIEVLKRGLALDPDRHHPLDKILLNLGQASFMAGHYAESLAAYRQILEVEAIPGMDQAFVAMDQLALGQAARAEEARQEALRLEPGLRLADFTGRLDVHPPAYGRMIRERMLPYWRRLRLPE